MTITFRTTVLAAGKTATGLVVPEEVVEELAGGRRPAVTVSLGGHTYRSTIAARGERYLIPLSAENRTAAGATAGDEVDVTVALDQAPRTVEVPDDLAVALAAAPGARAAFDALSFSAQRGLVDPIGQAKTAETRGRRIAKAVDTVAGRAKPA